jgi:hypothetical protein
MLKREDENDTHILMQTFKSSYTSDLENPRLVFPAVILIGDGRISLGHTRGTFKTKSVCLWSASARQFWNVSGFRYNHALLQQLKYAPVAQRLEQQTHNPKEALILSCTE